MTPCLAGSLPVLCLCRTTSLWTSSITSRATWKAGCRITRPEAPPFPVKTAWRGRAAPGEPRSTTPLYRTPAPQHTCSLWHTLTRTHKACRSSAPSTSSLSAPGEISTKATQVHLTHSTARGKLLRCLLRCAHFPAKRAVWVFCPNWSICCYTENKEYYTYPLLCCCIDTQGWELIFSGFQYFWCLCGQSGYIAFVGLFSVQPFVLFFGRFFVMFLTILISLTFCPSVSL